MNGVEQVIQARQQQMINGIYDCKAAIVSQFSASSTNSTANVPEISPMLKTDFSQIEKGDIDKAWNQMIPELSQTNVQVNLLIAKVTALERQWSQFDKFIKDLFVNQNNQQQYIQSWNLLVHSLTDVPEKKHGSEFSEWVVKKLNEILPSLKGALTTDQIDRSHIFRKVNKKKKTVIIIRFISRDIRNNVLKCRSDLKSTGIVITEHLTKPTLELLDRAKDCVGFKNAWTYEGKVFVSYNSRKIHINSTGDLPPFNNRPFDTYAHCVTAPAAHNKELG